MKAPHSGHDHNAVRSIKSFDALSGVFVISENTAADLPGAWLAHSIPPAAERHHLQAVTFAWNTLVPRHRGQSTANLAAALISAGMETSVRRITFLW
jgi:hypothetical protein